MMFNFKRESMALSRTSLPVITVSALNSAVAKLLEQHFRLMWISGEISNFTRAASGHWYFTLKDAQAQVRAVMFKSRAEHTPFLPKEGDKVEVCALVSLYTPRGDFQLSIESIRRAGIGNLFEKFLQLKEQLTHEGLFDIERKRTIPRFIRTVGIITSPNAAALRDILTTLQRRAPHVRIILYPTPVQGQNAAVEIANTLTLASVRNECDVLLLCRGGGSIEDLWSFNEEIVARTIVQSAIPIITGIGHETDFTIADFAADLRAATPTAAAEQASRTQKALLTDIAHQAQRLTKAIHQYLNNHNQTLDWLRHRLVSPHIKIAQEKQVLFQLTKDLQRALSLKFQTAHQTFEKIHARFLYTTPQCAPYQKQIKQYSQRLSLSFHHYLQQQRSKLNTMHNQLTVLNPQNTLKRGYAIVADEEKHILRHPDEVHTQQKLTLHLAKGIAQITVKDTLTASTDLSNTHE